MFRHAVFITAELLHRPIDRLFLLITQGVPRALIERSRSTQFGQDSFHLLVADSAVRTGQAIDYQPFDKILQLANVAWPGVAIEVLGNRVILGIQVRVDTVGLGIVLQVVPGNRVNVLGSLPQWRERKGKHVQPVIEIITKFAVGHCAAQIPVGRRYQLEVQRNFPRATDGANAFFLQHSQ